MRQLAALILLLASAGVALALGGTEPFGRIALSVGMPRLAAMLFADPQWRGVALYRAGRYAEAVDTFAEAGRRASFFRGNALARAGRLVDALVDYDVIIGRHPDDEDARANRALVAALVARLDQQDRGQDGVANGTATSDSRRTGRHADEQGKDGESSGDGMAGDREAGTTSASAGSSTVSRKGRAAQESTNSGLGEARGSATDSEGAGRSGGAATLAEAFEQQKQRQMAASRKFELKSVVASEQWLATMADEPGRYLKLRIAAEHRRREELGIGVLPGDDPW